MPTAAQRGMNARTALESAIAFYQNRVPQGQSVAQSNDVIKLADGFADWLDKRTREKK